MSKLKHMFHSAKHLFNNLFDKKDSTAVLNKDEQEDKIKKTIQPNVHSKHEDKVAKGNKETKKDSLNFPYQANNANGRKIEVFKPKAVAKNNIESVNAKSNANAKSSQAKSNNAKSSTKSSQVKSANTKSSTKSSQVKSANTKSSVKSSQAKPTNTKSSAKSSQAKPTNTKSSAKSSQAKSISAESKPETIKEKILNYININDYGEGIENQQIYQKFHQTKPSYLRTCLSELYQKHLIIRKGMGLYGSKADNMNKANLNTAYLIQLVRTNLNKTALSFTDYDKLSIKDKQTYSSLRTEFNAILKKVEK